MSKVVAEVVPFESLCQVLDGLVRTRKPDGRKRILGQFIDQWRKLHRNLHKENKTDDSFFDAMRLILPSFDKERGAYGFKEHMLANNFIKIFVLSKDSEDAQSLLKYRAPGGRSQDIGDFASKASSVLRTRLVRTEPLKIQELNERLDSIAFANANKDKKTVEMELEMLCRKVNEAELKWLIRILLKQMKLGMQETTVLSVFHPEASQLYDVTTSLSSVCRQLHEPETRLDTIQIQVFRPFRPMLANRTSPEAVPRIMAERSFFVEVKYDGERVQLHKDGPKYKYFSRNGNEFTSSYGGSPLEGSLTPFIHNVFKSCVESCILDGEMVGWNPEAGCISTKGEQFDVKALRDGDDLNPCLVLFDCLYLNGRVLTQLPLTERLELLEDSIFQSEIPGRLMLASRETKTTTEEVVEALNAAIERREEGLVIKRPESTYRLNTRSNDGGWLKIKPDYIDAVSDDLDLLLVGGYFGEGRRSNLLSHFLLAAACPPESQGGDPERFLTVCKVGSGYSMKELWDLNQQLNRTPLIRPGSRKLVPEWLQVAGERPDVYVEPKFSKILQVRAAEIVPSGVYAINYTLRFPRVEKIREDKAWRDCMTTEDFYRLQKESAGKLAQKLESGGGSSGQSPTKKRRGARTAVRPVLGAQFRPADVRHIQRRLDVFAGKTFCVLNGSASWSKKALEEKIVELGGDFVQHPGTETMCAVAGEELQTVKNVIAKGDWDVLRADWLVKCIQTETHVPWVPKDFLYMTLKTNNAFGEDFDQFGDSYTIPISRDDLKDILKSVPVKKTIPVVEMAELEEECFPEYRFGLFRRCRIYVDRFSSLEEGGRPLEFSGLEMVEAQLRLFGASLERNLDSCTHVLLHPDRLSRLDAVLEKNRRRTRKFHVVSPDWVRDSLSCRRLLMETKYHPIPSAQSGPCV